MHDVSKSGSNVLLEWLARLFVIGLAAAAIGLVILARSTLPRHIIEVRAVMSETGGWTPANLAVAAGQPLRLRLLSEDVVHGFAVGQMDWPALDLMPGKPEETTLVFDRPGRYVYYCTRWCGLGHWRMRGVIDVTGESTTPAVSPEPPLYVRLGIDLDEPHKAQFTPQTQPSPAAGTEFLRLVPPAYRTQSYYQTTSPDQAWQDLYNEPALDSLDQAQLWDLVAALWQQQSTPDRLVAASELYTQNCSACHGETGKGDGVMARQLAGIASQPTSPTTGLHDAGASGDPTALHAPIVSGHTTLAPTDFTDPAGMLGASPALLHGKIVRGGMGTGMPYWGPVFTDEQIWWLVAYLWTFQFD